VLVKQLNTLFLALSGVVAVIPGLATLVTGSGSTPGDAALFGAAAMMFGSATLAGLELRQSKVVALHPGKRTAVAAMLLTVGMLLLTTNFAILRYAVVNYDSSCKERHQFVFPLIAFGELRSWVRDYNGPLGAIYKFNEDSVAVQLAEPANAIAVGVTKGVAVAALACVSSCFVAAFYYLARREDGSRKTAKGDGEGG
jgi:hypothetical protein